MCLIYPIYISIKRFCHEDVPNEGYNRKATITAKVKIIIIYSIIYIFDFVVITLKFSIYNKERIDLTKIEADEFIEDFLEEVKDYELLAIFISLILLFCISLILFIIAWILSFIFTKRYFKLLNNCKTINKV